MSDDDPRPMSQEEIDAMFADALGDAAPDADAEPAPAADPEPEPAADPEPEPAAAEPDTDASGGKTTAPAAGSADDTDAFGGAAGEASGGTRSGASDSSLGRKVGQEDIDALLAELGAAPAPASAPEAVSPGDGESSSAAAVPATPAEAPADDRADDDDVIETVLGELQREAGGNEEPGNLSGTGPATDTLTADEIDRLVAKHQAEGASDSSHSVVTGITAEIGSASSIGDDSGGSGVINQDDIDALVQQMATATGEVEAPDATTGVTGATDQDPGSDDFAAPDSDELVAQAGPAPSVTDAVSPSVVDRRRPRTIPAVAGDGTALMSPDELKGTRYLLVVAVFLLAVCAITLGFVVSSVNGLRHELVKSNESQVTATDDFAEDMAVAEGWLRAEDPVTVAKGVKFLSEELKRNYPKKQKVLSERLARHYRSVGAHDKAVAEFAYIADRTSGLVDDPSFYLDYADSLARIGERDRAREVVYELIANEAWFLEAERGDGSVRGEARLATNRAALKRAMILLGRLYAPGIADELALAEDAP